MAEDFSGGAAERAWQALRRLRILFGVALILFGVLAFPRGARGLLGVFLFLAAVFVGVDVAGCSRDRSPEGEWSWCQWCWGPVR